jgi:hypothetical protein
MTLPATALVDSRLGPGTLTIDAADYSYQIANAALEPDISDEDGTPTLATPSPAPLATIKWKLTGTAIQDFEAGATSFLNYLMDNALAEVAFVFTPDSEQAPSYSGTVQIRPAIIGGDAGVQITSDFELPLIGDPVRDDTAPAAARTSEKRKDA